MKRFALVVPLLAVTFACHRDSGSPAPIGNDRKLEAPPPAPDIAPQGPAAGQPGAGLSVAAARPQGELQGLSRPTITFNKPVAALATLEQGDAANPARGFSIEPKLAGGWRWLGSASVEFVPAAQLPYSSEFKVTVPRGLAALDGSKLAEPYSFSFTTPVPGVIGAETVPVADRCQWSAPQQGFDVRVNQPLADAAHALFFELGDGARVEAKVLASANVEDEQRALEAAQTDPEKRRRFDRASPDELKFKSQVTRYQVQPATPLPAGKPFALALDVTARATQGPLTAKEGWKQACQTYGAMQATGLVRCWEGAERCTHGPIWLTFSNPVGKISELRARLHLEPAAALDWDDQDDDLGTEVADHRTRVRIPAHLRPGTHYKVSLDAGVTDQFGQPAPAYQGAFDLDDLEPSMFVGRTVGLLEAAGDGQLPAQTTNVAQLDADLWQLSTAEWLALRFCNSKQCQWPSRAPDAAPRIAIADPKNEPRLHGIDLRQAFHDGKKTGLVLARVWSPDTDSANDPTRVLVQITDVIAHAKVGLTSGVVWVTSAQTGAPRPGAQVVVLGRNGQQVAQATADQDGLATLPALAQLDPRPLDKQWEAPQLLVAATDQGDTGVVTTVWDDISHEGSDGTAFDGLVPSPLGVLFTDRGIYRPGDTVHIKGVLRRRAGASPTGLSTPAGATVLVSMKDPDGKELLKKQVQLSRYGTFSLDGVVPKDGRLGGYNVDAVQSGAAGSWYGSFMVAEYRAPTFRVDLLAGKSEILAGDPLSTTVSARYLFGGAMKGAKATWSVTRSSTDFTPPRNDGYSFGRQTWGYDEGFPAPDSGLFASGSGTIDGQGNLTVEAGKASALGDRPATYTVEAEVQDVSRQTVAGRTSVLLHPAAFYLGIASRSIFTKAGEAVKLPIVAARPDGSRVAGVAVKLAALQRAWHAVKKKGVGGVYESVSEAVDEEAGSCEVKTGSDAASCDLVLPKAGFYTLRAEAKDEQGRLALSSIGIYALGPGFAAWARGDSPRVELVADKSEYAVGDIAHVLIKSPYPECNALISVEREGVIERHVQKLVGTATSIDVPITEAMVPNVFVGAVLQRARVEQGGIEPGDDPGRPSVKAGTVGLSVGRAVKKLSVDIKVPKEEWRPREKVAIDLSIKDAAGKPQQGEITVYAVDEGVLRLTDYQVPELLSEMFPTHSLGVALGEPLLSLVRKQKFGEKGEVQPGGGGGKGPGGSTRTRFVTTALWTTVETDAQGHAQATLELPDNLTTFRIMAVATTDADRFGSGESKVRVSLPLLVLPALPRFARTGDAFEAGVVVNAKGLGAPQSEVKVSAELAGPVALAPGQQAEQTVTVEEGVAREVRFKLVATGDGLAKLVFKAATPGAAGAGGPFADGVEQQLPVQLPVDLEAVAVYGETAEKSVEGLLPPEGVRAGTGGLKVTLSSSALGGLADGMKQLVDYPYGCLEQLSSRLVPFVAVREVSRVFGLDAGANAQSSEAADAMNRMLAWLTERTDGATPTDPDQVVVETVGKIQDLQSPSGGFRYWPSASCSSAWPSIYATLALHRAKEAGYKVDAGVLAKAKKFVAQKAAGTADCPYETIGLETRAFALQVLARMGAPLPAYYDELYAQKDKLPLFGKALLADAILIGKGKRPRAQALMQDLFDRVQETAGEVHFAETDSATYAPLFSSDVRTTGMALQTLVDLEPGHPFISKIARYFNSVRRGTGAFRNTQEAAYALMGLTEVVRVRERTAPDFTAKVSLSGKELVSQRFKGRSLELVTKTVPIEEVIEAAKHGGKSGAPFLFTVDGQGLLQYGALLRYAPEKLPMKERDEGLFVQRWFEPYDSEGKAATEFQAGELVRVRVRVATRMERHYVAVEVPLPAGLEAVDLQLATSARQPTAQHQEGSEGEGEEGFDDQGGGDGEGWFYSPFVWSEKRDDRAIYFADLLPPGVHVQSFVARATTPGKFLLKPARAEEMYTPEVFGRSEGGTITVVAQKPLAAK